MCFTQNIFSTLIFVYLSDVVGSFPAQFLLWPMHKDTTPYWFIGQQLNTPPFVNATLPFSLV